MQNILASDIESGSVVPNIATLLESNSKRFGEKIVCAEKKGTRFEGIPWKDFYRGTVQISAALHELGFTRGSKMVIFSPNRTEMLLLEMAVMAMGGIAVPIYSGFIRETAEMLIRFCDAGFIAVSGVRQLGNVSSFPGLKHIIMFDEAPEEAAGAVIPFAALLNRQPGNGGFLAKGAGPDEVCLNMFTSGTTGIPKCVQLTHRNILSQQAALDALGWWNVTPVDRFLSYLQWHHSFGGIFELFNGLYHGAPLYLEPGHGKDPASILESWKSVKPTVFFSVPKIFSSLVEMAGKDREAEKAIFHSGLRFVFSAAAPLLPEVADEFEKRGIPVIEGWGLTETSPCCTLAEPVEKRPPGVVGKPLPGVKIGINSDSEILVKGPNVMKGYYKNEEDNNRVFTGDGWFRTGDIGEITASGLKLITRKDRVFKLSNGEKVIPTELEIIIQRKCPYIGYVLIEGSGRDYPAAVVFPNKNQLTNPTYDKTPLDGCFCPHSLEELSSCLHGCLSDANNELQQKFARVKTVLLIDDELSVDNNTLTPSLKLAPRRVLQLYKDFFANLYGEQNKLPKRAYIIKLNDPAHV